MTNHDGLWPHPRKLSKAEKQRRKDHDERMTEQFEASEAKRKAALAARTPAQVRSDDRATEDWYREMRDRTPCPARASKFPGSR